MSSDIRFKTKTDGTFDNFHRHSELVNKKEMPQEAPKK